MATALTNPRLSAAAARLRDAGKARYVMVKDNMPAYWEKYRPRSLLEWTGFCGIVLLAVSALSTILNILGGVALAMAWVGLVVYFFTVSASSLAAFFCGSATMLFSGTCAIIGTSMLSGVATVYGLMYLAGRARGYAAPYLEAIQERAKQQQVATTTQPRYTSETPADTAAGVHYAPSPAASGATVDSLTKTQVPESFNASAARSDTCNSDTTQKAKVAKGISNGASMGATAPVHRPAALSSA